MVMKNYTNNLILCGPTSCGKTWQVLSVADENKLIIGKDYEHLGGFTTPLELYQSLYKHNGKILIFDDISGITNDVKSISILKEAMWGTPGRWVHYSTTSDKLEVPDVFEFTGRIILIANKIENENDLNTKALLSRAISYTLELSKEQVMDVMIDIAKNGCFNLPIRQRLEVIEYIGSIADETTKELNLRSLAKAFDVYSYCSKENKDYKLMLDELFKPDEELVLIKRLINEYAKRSDAVKEYCNITGKSHMSFYRNMKKITN